MKNVCFLVTLLLFSNGLRANQSALQDYLNTNSGESTCCLIQPGFRYCTDEGLAAILDYCAYMFGGDNQCQEALKNGKVVLMCD